MFRRKVFKEIRKKRKYSLEYIAKQLEKNYKTIWNWEKGVTFPTKTDIIATSLILGVSVNEISDYEPIKNVNFAKQKSIDDYLNDINEIITKYGDIPGIYIDSIINLKKSHDNIKSENTRLHKNSTRGENLLNSITDLIYIKTKDFKIRKINNSFANYVGRTREFILGHQFTDFYSLDEIKEILRLEQDAFRNGSNIIDKEIILPGYNNKRKGLFSITPIIENGTITEIVCSIKDITERKELVNRLELLKQIIDRVDANIWIGEYHPEKQQKFDYIYINDKVKELFGYEPQDFTNDPFLWEKCIHTDHRSKAKQFIESESFPKSAKYKIVTKEGKEKYILDEAWLYLIEGKKYFFAVIRDISPNSEGNMGDLQLITEIIKDSKIPL